MTTKDVGGNTITEERPYVDFGSLIDALDEAFSYSTRLLYALLDATKPYTRNVVFEDDAYSLSLHAFAAEGASRIHDFPCEFALHMPLNGTSLKLEKFDNQGSIRPQDQKPSKTRFLLQGQIAIMGISQEGLYRISNPRKYVNALCLVLAHPPFQEHTTWATNAAVPKRTRIGCYSIRGIRTPRLEGRLSPHGHVLNELRDTVPPIPPISIAITDTEGNCSSRRTTMRRKEIRLASGDVLQLGETIGRGGFGRVFQVLNRTSGEFVAVKKIPVPTTLSQAPCDFDDVASRKLLECIESEILMLESLTHPNIVRYITTVRERDAIFIVTEWIESKSVAHLVEIYGNLEESLIALYVAQVLQGLSYLHSRRIIHKDIKGANVLVSKAGVVKLADFGLSVQLSQPSEQGDTAGDMTGTSYYMAPEVVQLKPQTTKSDVWSLGSLIVECSTGFPPYFTLSQEVALLRIVSDLHPSLPPRISDVLNSFLLKCWTRDPALRPDAEALLSHVFLTRLP